MENGSDKPVTITRRGTLAGLAAAAFALMTGCDDDKSPAAPMKRTESVTVPAKPGATPGTAPQTATATEAAPSAAPPADEFEDEEYIPGEEINEVVEIPLEEAIARFGDEFDMDEDEPEDDPASYTAALEDLQASVPDGMVKTVCWGDSTAKRLCNSIRSVDKDLPTANMGLTSAGFIIPPPKDGKPSRKPSPMQHNDIPAGSLVAISLMGNDIGSLIRPLAQAPSTDMKEKVIEDYVAKLMKVGTDLQKQGATPVFLGHALSRKPYTMKSGKIPTHWQNPAFLPAFNAVVTEVNKSLDRRTKEKGMGFVDVEKRMNHLLRDPDGLHWSHAGNIMMFGLVLEEARGLMPSAPAVTAPATMPAQPAATPLPKPTGTVNAADVLKGMNKPKTPAQ